MVIRVKLAQVSVRTYSGSNINKIRSCPESIFCILPSKVLKLNKGFDRLSSTYKSVSIGLRSTPICIILDKT